jgi:hypothetical protein
MHAIQIVLISFAVFAMSRVFLRYRRGGMRLLHLAMWLLFWVAVVVSVFHPDTTSWLAIKLGVGRGVDIAMYLSILTIFYLLFRSFGKLDDLDRQLTRVVRANAIREMEEELAGNEPSAEKPPLS